MAALFHAPIKERILHTFLSRTNSSVRPFGAYPLRAFFGQPSGLPHVLVFFTRRYLIVKDLFRNASLYSHFHSRLYTEN